MLRAKDSTPALQDGKIFPTDIVGGFGMGIGNVYYVVNDADTALVADMKKKYQGLTYDDGTYVLYIAAHLTADVAIQQALDSCMANRNDYVVVLSSGTNYSLTSALTMSKKGVHLICPTGLSASGYPVGNTARLKQLTASTVGIIISAQACEFAGFYAKNAANYPFITLAGSTYAGGSAGSASSMNIHHNMFPMVWSSSPQPIIAPYSGTDDGGSWGIISNNWFISETGTGVTAAIAAISINAQATGVMVNNNIVTIGDGNTATLCISNQAVKGHTDFNVFSESYSANTGAVPTGAITNCISIPDGGCAIGNRGAVATGRLITGGTANHSFVDNRDAASGGATPVES